MDFDGPANLLDLVFRPVERAVAHVRLAFSSFEHIGPIGRRYSLAVDGDGYAIVPSRSALHLRGVRMSVREADAVLVILSRHRGEWGRVGFPDELVERLGPFSVIRHDATQRTYTIACERLIEGTDDVVLNEMEADAFIVILGRHRRSVHFASTPT